MTPGRACARRGIQAGKEEYADSSAEHLWNRLNALDSMNRGMQFADRLLLLAFGRLANAIVHRGVSPGQDPWPGGGHQAPAGSCDSWRCEPHQRGRSNHHAHVHELIR
jgi:hypothetical protein